jgi:diguanylate cyclase (GGDEF)-like protein
MGSLSTFLGYNNKLGTTVRFTYLVVLLNLLASVLYLFIFAFTADNILINIYSVATIIAVILSLFLLKFRYYNTARFIVMAIMLVCISLLTFYFMPRLSLFLFYYFLIPPISVFMYDIIDKKDRIFIILFNLIFIILLALSSIIPDNPVITMDAYVLEIIRTVTVVFTGLCFIIAFMVYSLTLSKITADLKILAHTDPLTSISNRRVLFNKGQDIFNLTVRYNLTFGVMLIDIDHFKNVNDDYGHPIGDYVLKELTDIIKSNIRSNDILARYGGEEFAVIIKDSECTDLQDIGEHLRLTVQKHTFTSADHEDFQITISIGIVGYVPGLYKDFGQMVVKADKALYKAKETGRNKVVVYSADGEVFS